MVGRGRGHRVGGRGTARGAWLGAVPLAVVVACDFGGGGGGGVSEPLTVAERCAASCQPPKDDAHACAGRPEDPACRGACEARLTGKSEACLACTLGYAGWRGTTCSCDGVDLIGNVSCSECTWRANSKSCDFDLINKCTEGAVACDGWVPLAEDDPLCAEACGVVPNDRLARCQNRCLPPRDRDDPCSGAPSEARKVCVDACLALEGKSEACEACWFSVSAWMATSCTCSGSRCEECTTYANATGSAPPSCRDVSNPRCSPGNRCRGFQDLGIDHPLCAEACGVPARADGGVDSGQAEAGAEAGADGGPRDASDDAASEPDAAP